MRNLAGDEKCDIHIANELRRCGIMSEAYEPEDGRLGEVPSRLRGHLGPFNFRRAWYYWVVTGPTPLHIASELYANEIGKTDIRVAGHCGCPPPEEPWVTWISTDGREVIPTKQKEEWDKAEAENGMLWKTISKYAGKCLFSDDPLSISAKGYVLNYHIDSEVGLYIFCEKIRQYDLHTATRTDWWKDYL